jgi:hypothetical protein
MELIGSLDDIMLNFTLWKMRKFHEFYPSLITNLTQHDSHGPDDHPKSIDFYHLDMSRNDVMDENGIDWFCGCHHVGFWLVSWANGIGDFCPSLTTNLTQHDSHGADDHTKTYLIIIIWTCQEMMSWMRMELIGSLDVIMLNFTLWQMRKYHEFYPSLRSQI